MELTLNKITTEKWEVSTCSCGGEARLIEWGAYGNPENRHLILQCQKCRQETPVEAYYHKPHSSDYINGRYQAIIRAITSWENLNPRKEIAR